MTHQFKIERGIARAQAHQEKAEKRRPEKGSKRPLGKVGTHYHTKRLAHAILKEIQHDFHTSRWLIAFQVDSQLEEKINVITIADLKGMTTKYKKQAHHSLERLEPGFRKDGVTGQEAFLSQLMLDLQKKLHQLYQVELVSPEENEQKVARRFSRLAIKLTKQ